MRRYLILIPLLWLVACGSDPATKKKRGQKTESNPVKISVLSAQSREDTFSLDVKGETSPSDTFGIRNSGPVKIQKVFVEEGQKVKVGDPLISFDQTELRLRLELARAEIREMELALESNGGKEEPKEEKKPEGESTAGATESPKVVVEELGAGNQEKRRNLFEATLDRAKAAEKLYANVLQEDRVGSPVAGVVTKKRVTDGMLIDTPDSIIEIVRIDPMYFAFSLPVEDVPLLKQEASVTVRFPALKDQEVKGEILNVGGATAKENGKVEVKLKLPNEEGIVQVGMVGQVLLNTAEKRRLFIVPEEAVIHEGTRSYVFVVTDGQARRISVETAGSTNKGEAKLKSGVKDGDQLVIKSERTLHDNDAVEVK